MVASQVFGPQVPALYEIAPRRAQTGYVQSAASYIVELAARHSTKPSLIMSRAILPRTALVGNWTGRRRAESHLLNGYGKVAREVMGALTEATGGSALPQMTCLPWAKPFDPHGKHLLHKTRRWCPLCYRDQNREGVPCWDSLYACLRPVGVCAIHRIPLRSRCEACDAPQDFLTSLPFVDLCQECGADLGKQSPPTISSISTPLTAALWVADACVDLIAASWIEAPTRAHVITDKVQHVIDHFLNGDSGEFCRRTGVPKHQLVNYRAKQYRPGFAVFVDLCYRIDVPPRSLLFESYEISEPSTWRNPKRSTFEYRSARRTVAQIEEIKTHLTKYAIDTAVPYRTLQQIAQETGTSVSFLQGHFPHLYKRVRAKCKAKIAHEISVRAIDRRERRAAAEATVIARGQYPSQRRMKATGLVKPSDLRRKES